MRQLAVWMSIAVLAAGSHVADAKPRKGKAGKSPAKSAKKEPTKEQTIKAHMNRAARAHKVGKFEVALSELEAAYELDPQPKLLFAMAQVQQKLDRCDGAIDNYEKFLASTKDKQKQAITKQAIDACKTKLAAATPTPPVVAEPPPVQTAAVEPAPTPAPEPVPTPPASPPAATARSEPTSVASADNDSPFGHHAQPAPERPPAPVGSSHRPFYKDVVGDVLVLGGIAAGAGSFLMYSRARTDLDNAESASTLADYEQLVDRAHDRRTLAVIFAGAGGALVIGGIVRFALHGSGESSKVAVVPTSSGGLVTYSGGF